MPFDNADLFNGAHPCDRSGCDNTVPYDDEPYCFTHSDDSGSMIVGYSYKAGHPNG